MKPPALEGGDRPAVLVMAGGEAQRWKADCVLRNRKSGAKYSAVIEVEDKLFVPINGMPLLHRTLRQLLATGVEAPWVYNFAAPLADGARRFVPPQHHHALVDALAQTRGLWGAPLRVLLGDVVWSEAALAQVLGPQTLPWRFFGKRGRNVFTGKPWGEIYALHLAPAAVPLLNAALAALHGRLRRPMKLWDLYRALLGAAVAEEPSESYVMNPPASPHFCEIPDWTDDIDHVEEYLRMEAFLRAPPAAATPID